MGEDIMRKGRILTIFDCYRWAFYSDFFSPDTINTQVNISSPIVHFIKRRRGMIICPRSYSLWWWDWVFISSSWVTHWPSFYTLHCSRITGVNSGLNESAQQKYISEIHIIKRHKHLRVSSLWLKYNLIIMWTYDNSKHLIMPL